MLCLSKFQGGVVKYSNKKVSSVSSYSLAGVNLTLPVFCSLRETLKKSPSSAKIVGAGFRLEWLVRVAADASVCVCVCVLVRVA